MSNKDLFQSILLKADIQIDGNRPWDIQVHDEELYTNILTEGSIAFGEGYMDGKWKCDDISELISKILRTDIESKLDGLLKLRIGVEVGKNKLRKFFNPQTIERSKKDVSSHYDTGNDLFENMLDKRMTYTCAYWEDSSNIDEAQEAKLDLVCRKLDLKKGMRILDIGCGWGSFMIYAAEHYGVICDGLTLSKEQKKLGQDRVNAEGLDVTFVLQDYRDYQPTETYDRVVSIGMLEHVGPKNYYEYFECAKRFMKDDAIFLCHTIGGSVSRTINESDPWIQKYIFPNGVIPSMTQISGAIENKLNIECVHNIGPDYDKTLMAWYENFEKNWTNIASNYSEKFYLMWKYYLLSCAGAFRCRDLNVWQIMLTKLGTEIPLTRRAS
ncbi:cyclopropane fatty acyl phospholipid synthase [Moritella sp. 5]|uniref:cyclopropane fatty acyl phospholipid synthase n=1 Tax=Moritella sp. 5 TaxID=2746231 RepID=UPI001BA9A769|nr:cyclopropane fatty acyl phospholipid synthase [Moritella sp. 5]QUM82013.1 cyclopropane fatty acyl phospholipid synthase [Moritella sp. 5]